MKQDRVDCGEYPQVTIGCEAGHCLRASEPAIGWVNPAPNAAPPLAASSFVELRIGSNGGQQAPPTDAALLAAARPFNAYDGAKEITIRGSVDVLGFARAVLALGKAS